MRVIDDTARLEIFPEMIDHRVTLGPIRFGLPKGNAEKNVKIDGASYLATKEALL